MKPKLTYTDYQQAAHTLDIEVSTIQAVTSVESGGKGFLDDGRCIIRFEPHIFSQKTKGIYDKKYPNLSYPIWKPGYPTGVNQSWELYYQAAMLSPTAAVLATSWGLFQILGINYQACNCASLSEFVQKMENAEADQLSLFCNLILNWKLDAALRAKKWDVFAKAYNGPRYKVNAYDVRLAAAYAKFSTPTPDKRP